MGKHHILIIITIVIGFSTFMLGYSLPPFMEVGFGVGANVEAGSGSEADLMKQYEDLYRDDEE